MSKFNNNAVTWFEIPTADFERATTFYETLLDTTLVPFPGPEKCSIIKVGEGGVAGCLTDRPTMKPSTEGTLVYLNVDGKLDATLKRAEKLGTRILTPRTEIPGGFGFYACVKDSEGNHVGLHSTQF